VKRFRALIFDVDGTLAETEEIHRRAFNETFAYFGLGWQWSVPAYKGLLQVAGGKERIRRFLDSDPRGGPTISDDEIAELHRFKSARYIQLISEGVCALRPGIAEAIKLAETRGQHLAIATTTTRGNVEALLSVALGEVWTRLFRVIVAGDEVRHKKPAPDVYVRALHLLGLSNSDCLAIEDSRNGLLAARRAGIRTLVTRSRFFQDEEFSEAFAIVDCLTDLPDFEIAAR
jgi:HAD superfamily hydrolase (TIGR01509 family)